MLTGLLSPQESTTFQRRVPRVEFVIEDAVVVTMARSGGTAGAMLVRDGRVAAVGDPAEVRAAAGPGAQVARLDGATVVPGLIDAHCHVADVGYLAAGGDCSQTAAPDIPAIQARLREASARTPAASWVTGSGYVEYQLRENRHPTRDDLDLAVPDRPAVLYHTSLHACVLNSAALRAAGFEDRQPDPPGGAFGRDGEGRLNGVVFEGPMFALFEQNVRDDITRMGGAERARLMQRAGQRGPAEPGLPRLAVSPRGEDGHVEAVLHGHVPGHAELVQQAAVGRAAAQEDVLAGVDGQAVPAERAGRPAQPRPGLEQGDVGARLGERD